MGLPVLKHPKFKIKLPTSNKEVSFRPFLVGEEKILLMAMESGDMRDIVTAVEQIIEACSLTKIDVSNMPVIDVEYFFLQLRAKSKGEVVELKYTCDKCETEIDFEMNIDKITIKKDKKHNKKIVIDDTTGIIMKYPTLGIANELVKDQDSEEENEIETHFTMLKLCMESVYDEESVYNMADETDEEIENFMNSLPEKVIVDATNFIKTAPEVIYKAKLECPSSDCNWKDTITVKGIQNFFV